MDLFKVVGSIFIKNDDANSQIDNTTTKAQSMSTTIGSALTTAGSKITSIGQSLAVVSTTAGAVLTASVVGASNFTDGMAKMSTLFDTTQTSVSDLSNAFLTLSNKTGLSATELAEAGYQALSAGVDVNNAVSFVETAGNLAKAGFTSTSTAVDVLTTAMNAYGKGAGTAEEISNKLVRTQNLGKTTVDELASSMGKIIPTAASMGVNIDNLTSGYVALTKQGIATAEATTYMNSMLNELGDSGTTLGGVLKDTTGKSFQDLMNEGYSLADVLQITKNYADENGIAYNELWGSAEAGKAALSILNGGVEEFNSTIETMASDTNDVSDALDKLNTPSQQAKIALNQIKNSGISLGTAFLTSLQPTIDTVASKVESLTTWFNNLDSKTKTTIATVLAVVTALSPVLIVVGKVISVIGTVISSISTVKTALVAVKTALFGTKVAIGAISAPVIAVVAVIAILVGAFVTLWNTNEGFRTAITNIWNQIKQTVSDAIAVARVRLASLKEAFLGFVERIKPLWTAFCNLLAPIFVGAFQQISNVVGFLLDVFLDFISLLTALFNGDWSALWGACCAIFEDFWVLIQNTLNTAWSTLSAVFTVILSWFGTTWDECWTAISDFFTTTWDTITTTLTTVWDTICNAVQVAIMFLAEILAFAFDIITLPWQFIWENCKDTLFAIWDAIVAFFSPILTTISTLISTAWTAIQTKITTVVTAIQTKITTVWNSIKTTVTTVMTGIKTTFSTAWDSVKTTVTTKVDSIKTSISTGLESAKTTVTTKLNAIKTKFTTIFDSVKTTVQNAIDAIKAKFNFTWSLPHLKLPHVSISGSFSLAPPSVPKFSISWYKKAMDNPFMLTSPTLFDVNPLAGTAKGAGEAGDEIIYGRKNLMQDIREASGNDGLADLIDDWMEKLFNLMSVYYPQFGNLQLVTDTGALVGEIAPAMDNELGRIYRKKKRGV